MVKNNITDVTRWRTKDIVANQKELTTIFRKMPKITAKPNANQFLKLYKWHEFFNETIILTLQRNYKFAEDNYKDMLGFPVPLSEKKTRTTKAVVKKKITDETPVKLKYKGFDIITYKGKGEIWIAQAEDKKSGTTFIVYSKPNETKTAVEKIQQKITTFKKNK